MALAEKSVQLSEEVLEGAKDGQEAAIGAVRGFVDSVDRALAGSASPSQVQEVVDSALEMADRLVETNYEFLKGVVKSAGEAAGAAPGGSGKPAAGRATGRKAAPARAKGA
jgi:hypothetical protein